jgi:hypothetical protein
MASTVARAERLAKARQSLDEAIAALAGAFGVDAPVIPTSKDAAIEKAMQMEAMAAWLLLLVPPAAEEESQVDSEEGSATKKSKKGAA